MGPYFHSCPRDQPKARVRAKGWFLVHDDLAEIPSPCSSSKCKHTPSVASVSLTAGESFSRALRQDILSQHTTRIRTRNRHGRPECRLLASARSHTSKWHDLQLRQPSKCRKQANDNQYHHAGYHDRRCPAATLYSNFHRQVRWLR